MPRRATEFQTIRSEGGLLPPDLLRRIVDPAGKVSGVEPTAYGLPAGERLNEAITQSWNRLRRHWAEFRALRAANSESRIANGPERVVHDGAPVPPLATHHSPLAESEALTGLTNDKWSLPLLRELGFGFLATTAGPTIDGKTYAISRFAGNTAIHLVGCGVDLDRRAAGVRGAAAGNPHGLMQEFLNRSPGHLWAIVSNGIGFRILRDNQALSRQSFLEFDLAAMFDGEVYSDFVLLWLIAHATRFLPREKARSEGREASSQDTSLVHRPSDPPLASHHSPLAVSEAHSCWLETWSKEAAEQGVAALTDLRGGVEKALEILGQGFVSHPKNTALRDALRKGEVKLSDFHHQLLRVVYRLIFLFVAEDRELEGIPILHTRERGASGERRVVSTEAEPLATRYSLFATHYSTNRLRELASRIKGSRHGDLWRQFQLLVGALSGDARFAAMRSALALPPLGSMLWNPAATALLNGPGLASGEERGASGESITTPDSPNSPLATHPSPAELSNHDFLEALRHLAFIRKDKTLRPVDYKNLGSEEFGGVYESFLALTPQISSDGARFTFAEFAGNERKTSGSYYTPDSLVQCLLDSALDPVVHERLDLAARVARSEWRVVSEEVRSNPQIRKYVDSILPRLGGLAARHDAGGTGLQPDQEPPEGRTLRNDFTNPPGGSLDPGERGRGLGQGRNSGVSAVPANSSREPSRTGNTPAAGSASGAMFAGSDQATIGDCHDSQQATPQPPEEPAAARGEGRVVSGENTNSPLATPHPPVADAQRLWNSTPLATRHSLLASTAILSLKVCDMAVGSGHFLVGAGHRLARHLARVRALSAGESEPSPLLYQTALRDVIGHCLYGVDINPMAVELCKVTLWLEALEPGKPLSFLDHHIRCGNSLLGATPELIAAGLPDEAFDPIEGDDKAACSSLKKLNRAQREGLRHLFIAEDNAIRDRLRQTAAAIDEMGDSRPEDIQRKEAAFRAEQSNYDFQKAWDLANLWCAAFVVKKRMLNGESRMETSESNQSEPLATHNSPLAIQTGLFGGTEELPKAKGKRAAATRHSPLATPYGITTQHLRDFVENGALPEGLLPEARRLADQYQFFHWHLAFPEVFAQGGFDVLLGNPPWDRLKLNEQEWFAECAPEIAGAPTTAARKKLLDALPVKSPELFRKFADARRIFEGINAFIRASGNFPHGSGGELNLATLFAESFVRLANARGRVGAVLPTTIVTDKSAQPLCRSWLENGQLVAVFDFENRDGLFPHVHRSYKFAVITLRGGREPGATVQAAFYLQRPEQVSRAENLLHITLADIAQVNPNTFSFPVSRTKRDTELLLAIHRHAAPLLLDTQEGDGGPWGYSVFFIFEMNKDSGLFATESGSELLALLEAKLVHQFEHRAATFAGQTPRDLANGNARESTATELADANFSAQPRFWVPATEVRAAFARGQLTHSWAVVAREITNSTNERTVLSCIIPKVGMGHTCWTLRLMKADAALAAMLVGNFNSLALDYAARQKVGGTHLSNFILKQLPVFIPATYAQPCAWSGGTQTLQDWLLPRVLELTYTAWDLESFAQDCGWSGPPFRWDEERRFLLRCELDAAFFHLYLPATADGQWQFLDSEPLATRHSLLAAFPTPRDAVAYIMDTFPIVKRKDEEKFNGDYRTKRTILEIYDALAESMKAGKAYQTRLDPPPADRRCCHPAKPK